MDDTNNRTNYGTFAEVAEKLERLEADYETLLGIVRQRPDGHPESHLRAVEAVVINFGWDMVKEACIGFDTDKILQAQYEIYGELHRLWGETGCLDWGGQYHDYRRRTYALVAKAQSLL